MLRLKKDDDLFKTSTMSFGEHLEELRSALFRALLGIFLALIIAFPFADEAVRFVEGPLMRGLEKHYRRQATDQLLSGAIGPATVTDLQLVQQEKLLPRNVFVERSTLESSLGAQPTRDPSTTLGEQDIALDQVVPVVQKLIAASESNESSVFALIWQAIPRTRKDRLTERFLSQSESPEYPEKLRQELALALNDSLSSQPLVDAADWNKAVRSLESIQKQLIVSVHELWKRNPPGDAATHERMTRQLNRIVLSDAFPQAIRLPQADVVPLTIWESTPARIQTLGVPEAFMAWVKAWLVLTVLIASPWIFYQIWMFVAAGLYGHERKMVYVFLPFSIGLFLAGAAMAFAFVFDPVLDFLFEFNRRLQIDIEPRFNDWMGFVLLLPLGFGIAFQLPLVMLAVERLGVVTIDSYVKQWRFAVLGIFVISMLLTPADPISMLMMAIPLTFLYFGGILLCRVAPKHRAGEMQSEQGPSRR